MDGMQYQARPARPRARQPRLAGLSHFQSELRETELDRRRKLVVVDEPLFPGYIFIEILQDQRWVPIRSTYGINKLLTRTAAGSEYLEPAVIADSFINDLKQCSTP